MTNTHPTPSSTDIAQHQLECGVTVLVESNPSLRSTSLLWWIPTGSMHDQPVSSNAALSILCSGMLERGAGDLDSRAFNDSLDRLGVVRSVSIHPMSTQINATFRREATQPALSLFTDMVCRPSFSDDCFEPVRSLCLQSIEGLVDDPSALAANHLRRMALPAPYNRDSYGSAELIRSATMEHVRSAWELRGRPEGGIIALAGNVDIKEVVAHLEQLLADWRGAPPDPLDPVAPSGGDHHLQLSTSQSHIEMAFQAPTVNSDDELPFLVASRILGGGASSRLFESVRERQGLCYDVHSGYLRNRFGSLCTIGVGTTPERVQQTLDSIYAELDRLGDGGVTAEEFSRVRVGLKTRLMMHGESTSARAVAMAQDLHQRGLPRTMSDVARQIDELDFDQVNALIHRLMTPQWRSEAVRVAVGPESPFS